MPQYLRVRRRRNAQTATMIRLEGLLEGRKRTREVAAEMEALANLNLQHCQQQQQDDDDDDDATYHPSTTTTITERSRKRRTAVWRRVESENFKPDKCRVIDAVLEEEGEDAAARQGSAKRRKLMLVSSTNDTGIHHHQQQKGTIPPKSGGYKILHPLERLVDESLQQVAVGSRTAAEHWEFCRKDPAFIEDRQKFLTWCNREAGTILHVCALWNDSETMANVLSGRQPRQLDMETFVKALDGEGRTAYQVAQLSGHEQACQVLEAFGGDTTAAAAAEDDAFVIDVYCLDENGAHSRTAATMATSDENINESYQGIRDSRSDEGDEHDDRVTCELLGGVGYWDERGELVLEIPDTNDSDIFNDEKLNDDDEDSNSENWDGNDYPDIEEDDDDDEAHELSFRHCDVQLPPSNFGCL